MGNVTLEKCICCQRSDMYVQRLNSMKISVGIILVMEIMAIHSVYRKKQLNQTRS